MTETTQLESPTARQRWERECETVERELRLKESELELKRAELRASKWWNPLVVAIMAVALAAVGNIAVAYRNGEQQRAADLVRVEQQRMTDLARAEESRVLTMLKTTSTDQAAENLSFLLEAGLIADEALISRVKNYLSKRTPAKGPLLTGSYDSGTWANTLKRE